MEIHSSILVSIREPFIVLDPDLKVVTANDAFSHTFGVKPEDSEGLLITIWATEILGLDRSTLRTGMRKLFIRKP